MKDNETDLRRPEGLSEVGNLAHAVILAFLEKHEMTYTGGCKAFYSPAEWKDRGEDYCTKSLLVVVYDGGAHKPAFTLDAEAYDINEALQEALAHIDCFFEEGTHWYGGVYASE